MVRAASITDFHPSMLGDAWFISQIPARSTVIFLFLSCCCHFWEQPSSQLGLIKCYLIRCSLCISDRNMIDDGVLSSTHFRRHTGWVFVLLLVMWSFDHLIKLVSARFSKIKQFLSPINMYSVRRHFEITVILFLIKLLLTGFSIHWWVLAQSVIASCV